MLITQGYGFLLLINWAWLMVPIGLWLISVSIVSLRDSQLRKKGLPDSDKTGTPGYHVAACVIAMIMIVVIPLSNLALGMGPHYGDIAKDIKSQFNLEHVKHVWIGVPYEGEYKWIAKDPDGLFVMCNTEKTKSADTFKFVCDSGKDYQKESIND